MGFVMVRVEGKTFPYRNELRNELGLEYDWRAKDFKGAFGDKSRRLNDIEIFCKKHRLTLYFDGEERYNPKEQQKKAGKQQTIKETEDLEDLDEFNLKEYLPVLESLADEKDVGKVGVVKHQGHDAKPKPFLQVDIDESTPISGFNFDELSENTQFHPFRDIQKQVLAPMMEAIEAGYQNIVVELPVGGGKSVVAKTISQAYGSPSYIITHLKGLQAQYLKEMPFMRSVMGRGNYDCLLDVEPGLDDVGEAKKALDKVTDVSPETCSAALAPCKYAKGFSCTKKNPTKEGGVMDFNVDADSLCDYYGALTKAQNSMYFVGNTAYMMGMNRSGKVLPKRPFLIVDEAHQLANNMMSFYALSISQRMLEKLFRAPSATEVKEAKSEAKKKSLEERRNVILKQFDPQNPTAGYGIPDLKPMNVHTPPTDRKQTLILLTRYLMALHDAVKEKMKDKDSQTKYDKKELSYASNAVMKMKELMASIATDWENWVYQVDESNQIPTWVSFKPVKVSDYADDLLLNLGEQRIFLTGTVLDYDIFGRELGLNQDDTAFVKVHYSPFPEKNRPVYTHIKGGSLSRANRGEESYKKCADAIAKIAAKYPDGKGLILPYTDQIEDGIVEALSQHQPLVHGRVRQHSKVPRERDAVFREFETEPSNEILVSTYANQGFDGKMVDFTIIVKVPFGPLGDIQVKTKADNDPKWYQMMTAVELAQMCGRNVRSATDVGHTYIIDPSFMFHFERGMSNNPMARVLPTYLARTIINNRNGK